MLRSAVWGEVAGLSRVGGVTADLPDDVRPGEMLVAVVTRLVLVGADGWRLHEEVLLAARALPETGRSRRLEVEDRRYEQVRLVVERALDPDACRPVARADAQRLATEWPALRELMAGDVAARAATRKTALQRDLDRRQAEELQRVGAITEHMRRTLSDALAESPTHYQPTLDEMDEPEREQLIVDRSAWQARLDGLDDEQLREQAAVTRRYEGVRELTFPVAVVLVARAEPA